MIGYGVTWALVDAIGEVGAWIVLDPLFVVGMLLYFNMTVGDVVAAWLQRRDERDELAKRRGSPGRAPFAHGADPGGTARAATRSASSIGCGPLSAVGRTTMRRR